MLSKVEDREGQREGQAGYKITYLLLYSYVTLLMFLNNLLVY